MGDKNRVEYGIKSVKVWPIISEDATTGVPTYGTVIDFPSARSLSLDSQESVNKYFADDSVWVQINSSKGQYDGDFNFYHMPTRFEQEVLRRVRNADGVLAEDKDLEPLEFAMGFIFEGDKKETKRILYKVKATSPSISHNTTEEDVEPEERSISISAVPRKDNGITQVKCEEGEDGYASFFGAAPYEYTATEYEEVTSPTGNPSTSGYYELTNGVYYPSEDTTVGQSKTYYKVKTGS